MKNSHRTGALASALLAFAPLSAAASVSQAAPVAQSTQEQNTQEDGACTCTCAACVAKHGAKVKPDGAAKVTVELTVAPEVEASTLRRIAFDPEIVELLTLVEDAERRTERGYLGVFLGDGDGDGALVASVVDGGAAARGGIKPGDLIVVAEELPIRTTQDLLEVLTEAKPGDVATFEIERGTDELRISLALGSRSSVTPAASAPRLDRIRLLDPIVETVEPAPRLDRIRLLEPIVETVELAVPVEPTALRADAERARVHAHAMRLQIVELELQVAELRAAVIAMKAELDRR